MLFRSSFLIFLVFAVALMTLWIESQFEVSFSTAFRLAAFNVTSILTTTGFVTADFTSWGSFALGAFFVFYFVGGCAGSASGGIKIFRWNLLFASVRRQFHKMRRPHEMFVIRFNGERVSDESMYSVVNFFFLYILIFALLSLMLMATGIDFLNSVSGVAESMANVGPGLGDLIGPHRNFSALGPMAKWILCAAMLLGRLELFTALVLLTRSYWRS